jgi:hypothetical protein
MAAPAFKYSRCMRAHGVPDFPDPVVRSSDGHASVGIKVNPAETSSPQFTSAQRACASIMPAPNPAEVAQQQRAEKAGKLSFARCIRQHGIRGFPDPDSQGRLTPEMLSSAGIDLHAPALLTAAEACVGASHGTITKAQVEQAVKGGH